MPPGFTMTIVEQNNRVGEMLAHFPGNNAYPERVIRTVRGGIVARMLFQGNCTTRMTGTRIHLRGPSRLTGGTHRYENCRFLIAADYTAPAGQDAAITSNTPAASRIEVVGGTLQAAAAARPPRFLFDRNGKHDGPGTILIDGLKNSSAMQVATGKNTQVTLLHMGGR